MNYNILLIKKIKMEKIKMEKIKMENIGDNTDCYIHFADKDKLDYFINKYKAELELGHRCCYDKGCHIKSFKGNEITDYDQIKDIYLEFDNI